MITPDRIPGFGTNDSVDAIMRALDFSKVFELRDRAFDTEDIDPCAHQKAAWDYGKYVNNAYVAGTARILIEFLYQFPMYTYADYYSRVADGKPGRYQPYLLNAPGGIKDSFQDIKNTIDGARGIPLDFVDSSTK